jgi:transcriptional regulator with XRE-family HTH domain
MKPECIDGEWGPDGPEGRALGEAVGENLARHRRRCRLDLDTLAERSGIPVDLLVLFEAGQAVPSLRTLWRLATALDVPFGALLSATRPEPTTFRVVRGSRGQLIASRSGQLRSRALFPLGDPCAPEVYELTLAPHCFEAAPAHGRETFEHVTAVRGALVIETDDHQARLGLGDALFFRADRPHRYRNPSSCDAVAHLVIAYAWNIARMMPTAPSEAGRQPGALLTAIPEVRSRERPS